MPHRWKVPLIGDAFDLDAMLNDLKNSDTKIIKDDETYCLIADQLDAVIENNSVFAAVDDIINEINLAYQVSLPDFHPVKSADIIIERYSDGSERRSSRAHLHLGGLRMRASVDAFGGSSDAMPRTPLSERVRKAMRLDDNFHLAPIAFSSSPKTFSNLYIVCETVRRCNSPNAHYKSLNDLGWATQKALDRFRDTANFHRHGYPRDPLKYKEMTIEEAMNFIRSLLIRWAEALALDCSPTS